MHGHGKHVGARHHLSGLVFTYVRTAPSTTTSLDSLFPASGLIGFPSGSVYENDVQLSAAGLPVDPISRLATVDPLLVLDRRGGVWVAEFTAQKGFGADAFIDLESSQGMASTTWSRLARVNDAFEFMEAFATGVEKSMLNMPGNKTRYSLTLPPTVAPNGFLRLRVSQERHAMDP